MTPKQLMALGKAFTAYLRIFEDCVVYRPTAEHLHSYCRGLLSDLARKSIEPMALACGTAVRTLQEFLRDHVWDHFRMRDQLQQRLARQPALAAADELGTIGVIDETSVAKKGSKTPGVHRQYCGSRGKLENCIVTVHLGIVRGLFKTLLDAAHRLHSLKMGADDHGTPAPKALRLAEDAHAPFDKIRRDAMETARGSRGLAAPWHGPR